MNQTWENNKKHNFGPDIGLFGPNLDPRLPPPKKNFFSEFYLCYMLVIVPNYHPMQFKNSKTSNSENSKKPSFRYNFGPFGPNLGPQIFYGFYLH